MHDGRVLAGARSRPILDPTSDAPAGIHDERAIADAVLAGDRDAFRRLVEREADNVVRACQRILADRHDAEDVAQEAFVTAFRSLGTWRAEGPFGAWVTRIAVRLALRQAGKRRPVVWLDPFAEPGNEPLDPSPDIDPALSSVRAERATMLRRAVAELAEPYREIVSLRFFGGLTLDEIAHETGRPLGTVKTQLHRGLGRLRSALDAEAHP